MADVNETELPGVGIRYDYLTRDRQRLGVLVHRTGWRELLLYAPDDPDACTLSLRLEEDEARTLAELLGAAQVATHVSELHQQLEGVAIDWIRVADGGRWAGLSLAEAAIHTQTGVSVVAIVRDDVTIPAPRSSERLLPGDVAVAVGTTEGLADVTAELRPAQT